MRKTKRIFPMLLALVMILSLCACGGKTAAPEKCFSLSEQKHRQPALFGADCRCRHFIGLNQSDAGKNQAA